MKMYERIKIHCAEGVFGQIRLFNFPICKYERVDGKLRFSLIHANQRNKNLPVVYLKYNNPATYYSPWCIQHWLNIFAELNYYCYIVCDNSKLEKYLLKTIFFQNKNFEFIKSNYSIPRRIIELVCTPNWEKAAYAHLTTFYHAKKNNIKEFWNIDADDTSFMERPEKVRDILLKTENIARSKNFDLFSLDMHRSRYYGKHWTFGITFTRMGKNWSKLLCAAKNTGWRNEFSKFHEAGFYNVDSYFAWLKNHNLANIGTFNINNLYFVHWGGFFSQLLQNAAGGNKQHSIFSHWSESFQRQRVLRYHNSGRCHKHRCRNLRNRKFRFPKRWCLQFHSFQLCSLQGELK